MLALNVSYNEKEEAKALGARWNPKEKLWMAPGNDIDGYMRFAKWIDGSNIIRKELCIVEAARKCWKCGKETPVICFAIRDYYSLEFGGENVREWTFTSVFSQLPEEIFSYVKSNYNFKLKYSNTIQQSYYANCCKWCDSLQGNNYLFNEVLESPFYVNNQESAQRLTMHRIQLPYDFSTDLGEVLPMVIGFGSVTVEERDWLIDNYACFKDVDISKV